MPEEHDRYLDIDMDYDQEGAYEGSDATDLAGEQDFDELEAELEQVDDHDLAELVEQQNNTPLQNILNVLFHMQQPIDIRQSRGNSISGVHLQGLHHLASALRDDHEEVSDGEDFVPDSRDYTKAQEAGLELLMSGEFGRVGNSMASRRKAFNLVKHLHDRSRSEVPSIQDNIQSRLVPNSNGTAVATYTHNVYCGEFSTDASIYYTCGQDYRLHVYDMTAPRDMRGGISRVNIYDGHHTTMKVINTIDGHPGRWTITDSHLSPDNEKMIYSSLTPTVHMTSVRDSHPVQIPLRMADPVPSHLALDSQFEIWSCRYSADGKEVIAGGSGKIFVYDLLADRRTVKILAHNDDVNGCCWADSASGNVLISASDDHLLKVWDRRSLGSSPKPSGVLVGHTEGITCASAKGDGRYVISNGKDQALKLWDLRKMHSSADVATFEHQNYGHPGFDYRYDSYSKGGWRSHPKDCSVMTYRGHAVLRTLIRCHFSPAETTGSAYIYSGSKDGRIHIWSLDGRVVQILDRSHTLAMRFDPSGPEPAPSSGRRERCCVRDVSWSPEEPVIMSAGWEDNSQSTVARHEWKGLSKRPHALEDWVERQAAERADRARRRAARQHVLARLADNSDHRFD